VSIIEGWELLVRKFRKRKKNVGEGNKKNNKRKKRVE
jgi:hypothetical protein